ncbi:MAG: energy-coupling factor ABC transporter ATP-binding protein [Caulobacteraceae bacterium]
MSEVSKDIIFHLNNVTFAYPLENPILKDIYLDIYKQDRTAILGANGCGKSTLLKIFAGLLHPQGGLFQAFGDKVTEKSFDNDAYSKEYHRKVGFIFQDSDVQLFCATVEEEIAFGPLQLGLKENEVRSRINDVINMLNIEHLRNRTPFKLSGGEKKKVAVASVLIMNPEVLILDEPTNGLDPRSQRWLINLLNHLNNAGKTLIVSTHNLELVHEISDRAILFSENHKIAADLPTINIIENKNLLRSANFI